jgi:MYXO-CTERM domain-containing protein
MRSQGGRLVVGVVAMWSSLWVAKAEAAGPPAKLTLASMTAQMAAGQNGYECSGGACKKIGHACDVAGVPGPGALPPTFLALFLAGVAVTLRQRRR